MEIKRRLCEEKSKYDFILYGVLAILFIVPFVTTEGMIASCGVCQSLIELMSSIIPGIGVMSGVSKLPQTVALEMSLMWALAPLVSIIEINKTKGVMFKGSQIKITIFLIFLLLNEFWLGIYTKVSFFHGTITIPRKSHLGNLSYKAIQDDLGIGIFAIIGILYIAGLIAFVSIELYKALKSNNYKREN